jgi:TRAP-type C4-dicarboxylate transport system permease small subunit
MMSLQRATGKFDGAMRPVTRVLHFIGIGILALLMFFTAFDVILRNISSLLNTLNIGTTVTILGWFEITEYLMVILVSFTLAYCAIEKGHVVIELAVSRLSRRTQAVLGCITNLLSLGFFIIITWQSALYVTQMTRSSTVLIIPANPFVALLAVGCGVLCLILLLHFLEPLSQVMTK